MDVLYPNCAGLDIHKDTVVACSRRTIDGKVIREVRTFKTTTGDLLALSDGFRRKALRTSRWRRRASIGSQSGIS
jgi:hypothetical protein